MAAKPAASTAAAANQIVERLEPRRGHVGGVRSRARDAQVDPERESQLTADEPLTDGDGDRHDHRFGAQAENQAAGGHDRKARRHRGQEGAARTDDGKQQRRKTRPKPVDDDAADEHHDDVGKAVDRVERADLRIGEAEQALQRVGHRANGIVDVVVAEHGDTQRDQHGPAPRRGGRILRCRRLGSHPR